MIYEVQRTLTSAFNSASAGVGTIVDSIETIVSAFYSMGHASSYVAGLPKLCHKCVLRMMNIKESLFTC
jgi:hypothetical protein